MDIIGELPVEISQEIFSYLSGEDLANCSMVNQKWRKLTNSNIIWKRLCLIEGLDVGRPLPRCSVSELNLLDQPCEYKRLYARHGVTLQKWRENNFKSFDLQDVVGTAYFNDGTILVVMYWDGCIDVFNLTDVPKIIQSLPTIVHGSLVTFTIRNDNIVVFRTTWVFICYKWKNGRLNFLEALYILKNGDAYEIRSTTQPDTLYFFMEYEGILFDIKAIIGDTLVLYIHEESTIHFWSLEESRCSGKVVGIRYPKCNVFKDILYVSNFDEISAYNIFGVRQFSIYIETFGYNVRHVDLQFNDCITLAVMNCAQGLSLLKGWDIKLKKTGDIKEKLNGIVLHPILPAAIYLCRCKMQSKSKVVMRNLLNLTVLWETFFPSSLPLGTVHEDFAFFSIIKDRYLLCFPRYDSSATSKERILYNIKTGKQIYRVPNEGHFIVNYSNDRLIEVTTYGEKHYVGTKIILYC